MLSPRNGAASTDSGISEADANVYAEGVRRGGLLSVRVPDADARAMEAILLRHHPVDIRVRGDAYRSSGWSTFDESAPPYGLSEIERERALYGAALER